MIEIIDVNTMFGPLPAAASDLSVDALEVMMKKHGIKSCCTLSTVGVLLDQNSGNSATRAACSEHSQLLPVATVNPQNVYTVDGPYTRFKADGFRMVRLFPAQQGWTADYAPCVAVAKRLEVEGLPIMADVMQPGEASRLVRALMSHPAPLILCGVGEDTLSESIFLMRSHPGVFIESSNLVSVGALKQVVDSVGADRVLYGSGAPSRPMASSLAIVRAANITEDQREQILNKNAVSLLGL